MEDYRFIGKPVSRIDAPDKVSGQAIFIDDIKLPGMLYGKILRSPLPHARILHIDTSAAEGLPGVKAVVTAIDAPRYRFGISVNDEEVFARNKVRFVGDRVAAVAATHPDLAEEALGKIKVEYQELPAVFDPLRAMQPDAPIIHEDLATYDGGPFAMMFRTAHNTIIPADVEVGDVEKGFSESDYLFEDTFTTQVVHQSYIEPRGAIARIEPSGRITLWKNTQGQFIARGEIARIMRVPLSHVRIIPTEIGGGFGGKLSILLGPICILLARKSGKPVKIMHTREEEFIAARPRHGAMIELKTGVKKDGTLVSRRSRTIIDSGAYVDFGLGTATRTASTARGPYRIPNAKLEAYCVYTNKVPGGAFRAPGAPQITFAVESQMDIIARQLAIDPLELRLKNGLQVGDVASSGQKIEGASLSHVLTEVANGIGWDKPKAGQYRGRGLACGEWNTAGTPATSSLKINEDGSVAVYTGVVNLTGSTTVFAQIAAEEFCLPLEKITVVTGDTDSAPFAPVSGGSMIAYNVGRSVLLAAKDAKNQLFELASQRLEAAKEELNLNERGVFIKHQPDRVVSLDKLALASMRDKNGLIMGKGSAAPLPPALILVAQAAEVEVDPETGQVKILKISASQDSGFSLNPLAVSGQIQGGVAQGLGYALTEELMVKEGRVLNSDFLDYKLLTFMDIPEIEVTQIQEKSPAGPYGARGVGEPPCIPTAPAIANAIYDAIGVRVKELPLTPERIVAALKSQKKVRMKTGDVSQG
ncbi:MAG: xanthine dehydrogenase family protein molybdopterin-binding subunit [Candidatus Tectomicrobia bacterium]|uniref:Xanthine dehydrogenase family protein molybdopterin-binding subunit n=1 Tax=Tectimicrobiota bacterium TaxID=2528274 RepID=A0A933GJW3_UNCTE|nr:xanthine dehydrogenase family protein molybdopterin-binding subunit [Candidatus Tectomicrobia bacterium]